MSRFQKEAREQLSKLSSSLSDAGTVKKPQAVNPSRSNASGGAPKPLSQPAGREQIKQKTTDVIEADESKAIVEVKTKNGDFFKPKAGTYTTLTGADGRFELTEANRAFICLLNDGRLFISEAHKNNHAVHSLTARLKRSGFEYQIIPSSLAQIKEIYEGAKSDSVVMFETDSDMQRLAKTIFGDACEKGASDIHIRVSRDFKTQILYRINNDITPQQELPYEEGVMLCTAIYQSMCSVSDKAYEIHARQDARISDRDKLPSGLDGIRIATSPMSDGNLMVLRLLYNAAVDSLDLGLLGYVDEQKRILQLAKKRPIGLNVIAGPTGSGKSTTLQRVLMSIIQETMGKKHIITVEDPAEYPIRGAVQTSVSNANTPEERARAFQAAIKSCMRLDPDVMMIGEVRDPASASLVIEAAMTGHQVWTTVHANTALAVVDRLLSMNLDLEEVTDHETVTSFTCQRLLQTLCPHCKRPLSEHKNQVDSDAIDRFMNVGDINGMFIRGPGCDKCNYTGTKGRTVVAETVMPDNDLMMLLRKRDKQGAIDYWKSSLNGILMVDHAANHVSKGISDPRDAELVVGYFPQNLRQID